MKKKKKYKPEVLFKYFADWLSETYPGKFCEVTLKPMYLNEGLEILVNELYGYKVLYFEGTAEYPGRLEFSPRTNIKIFGGDFGFYRKGYNTRLEFPFNDGNELIIEPSKLERVVKIIDDGFIMFSEQVKEKFNSYYNPDEALKVIKWLDNADKVEMVNKYIFDDTIRIKIYNATNDERFLPIRAKELFLF